MTVSFVLNNKPGQVSAETRERVLKAIRELEYRPAAIERAIKEREILTLGIVAGVDGHSLMQPGYYQSIANGILMAADQLRHNITLFTHSLFHSNPRQSLRVYSDGRCDGLMVLAPHRECNLVAALHERGIPFVLIGDTGDQATMSYVDIDNIREGYRTTEYLIQRGHRRIAFIGGPDFVRSARQRFEGYQLAMEAYGLQSTNYLTLLNNLHTNDLDGRIIRMLSLPVEERPTAIFGWNDGIAVQAMQQVQAQGLNVPNDISIIGIDDDVIAMTSQPQLTTARQPYEAIGRRVVEILVDKIRGDVTTPQRELLPTQFIERASVVTRPQ